MLWGFAAAIIALCLVALVTSYTMSGLVQMFRKLL